MPLLAPTLWPPEACPGGFLASTEPPADCPTQTTPVTNPAKKTNTTNRSFFMDSFPVAAWRPNPALERPQLSSEWGSPVDGGGSRRPRPQLTRPVDVRTERNRRQAGQLGTDPPRARLRPYGAAVGAALAPQRSSLVS